MKVIKNANGSYSHVSITGIETNNLKVVLDRRKGYGDIKLPEGASRRWLSESRFHDDITEIVLDEITSRRKGESTMNTNFYVEMVLSAGNKKVQNLYKNTNRPISMVEMKLITRLSVIDERLSREEADNLGFSSEARELRRDYRKVNRLLAKVCNRLDKHHEWLLYVDFRQFDRWL